MVRQQRILSACEENDIGLVQTLLKEGVPVDEQDIEGTSPLQIAAANGYESLVDLLLKWKALINLPNSAGWTPLMQACKYGHTSVVLTLIKYGAIVKVVNKLGIHALSLAAGGGHLSTVRVLLETGVDIEANNPSIASSELTPLMAAAFNGHNSVVRLLLERGVSVHQASPTTGITPLMLAACGGHKQTVQILVEWGANTNLTNVCDKTALDIAIARGKREVKAYLEDKTDTRPQTDQDKREVDIMDAVKKGDLMWVKQILKEDITRANWSHPREGATPLIYAAMLGHLEIVKLLVSKGVSLNKQDNLNGWTALMQAVFHGRTQVVQYLIEKGADVNIPAFNDCTALDLACLLDSIDSEIPRLLVEKTTFLRILGRENSPFLDNQEKSQLEDFRNASEETLRMKGFKGWLGQVAQRLQHLKFGKLPKSSSPHLCPISQTTNLSETKLQPRSPKTTRISLSSFRSPAPDFSSSKSDNPEPVIPPLLSSPVAEMGRLGSCIMPGKRICQSTSKTTAREAWQPRRLLQNYQMLSSNVATSAQLDMESSSANSRVSFSESKLICSATSQETVKEYGIKCNEISKDTSRELSKTSHVRHDTDSLHSATSPALLMTDTSIAKGGIQELLKQMHLEKYVDKFEEQEVDLGAFVNLKEEDLQEVGVLTSLNKEQLLTAIQALKQKNVPLCIVSPPE